MNKVQCDFCREWFDISEIHIAEFDVDVKVEGEEEPNFILNNLINDLKKKYMEPNGPKDKLLPFLQEATFSCGTCLKKWKEKCKTL